MDTYLIFQLHLFVQQQSLGLDIPYVPHSLRHGGATFDFMNGHSITDIMARGRWAATKSALRYIQEGRQLLMMNSIPPWIHSFGLMVSQQLVYHFISTLRSTTKCEWV
jgi:hypothetical protein